MAELTDATRHDDSASSPTASELTFDPGYDDFDSGHDDFDPGHDDFASSFTASGSASTPYVHSDVFINLHDYDDSGSASTRYVHSDVFINLRDYNDCVRDVMTFATRLCNRLKSYELQVVLDNPILLYEEDNIPSKIQDSIFAAPVHIAIIPPNYVHSKWCLDELVLMIKTSAMLGTTIYPVFYSVKPNELRYDGAYAKALSTYEQLYGSRTIQDWKDALFHIANISGFVLDEGPGGEEELLANVVKSVRNDFPYGPRYDVFLNYRGIDHGKDNFAKSLYHGLVSSGLRVFLDKPEMVPGLDISRQIEVAIQLAHVNIAIFSPKYAESTWCLHELVLMVRSRATILPVFCQMRRSDLLDGVLYAEALLNHEKKQRYDSTTIKNWRDALSKVAQLPGYELGGDEKELQHKIVQSVLDSLAKQSADVRNSEVELQRVLKSVLKEDVPKRVSQEVEDEKELQPEVELQRELISALKEDVPKRVSQEKEDVPKRVSQEREDVPKWVSQEVEDEKELQPEVETHRVLISAYKELISAHKKRVPKWVSQIKGDVPKRVSQEREDVLKWVSQEVEDEKELISAHKKHFPKWVSQIKGDVPKRVSTKHVLKWLSQKKGDVPKRVSQENAVRQQIATFLVSCGLLPKVWDESVRASNAESFTLNEYDDVAYVTFPSFQRIEGFIVNESKCGEGKIQPDHKVFSGCLKGNDGKAALIHPGALTLFLHIMEKTDFEAKLQIYTDSKQRKLKPIIFVGHSLGGAVATLATLWVLGKRLRQSSAFCITFGCPLVGDERLVEAVGRENWGGNFCHVVSEHDIVPRMLLAPFDSFAKPFTSIIPYWQGINIPDSFIQDAGRTLLKHVLDSPRSPYRPFGTYMFCSSNGAACIENSQTVLEMLNLTVKSQEISFDEVVQASLLEHIRYGPVLEEVIQNSMSGRRIVTSNSEDSYEMGISLQLEAIGIGAQNDQAQHALLKAGEMENRYNKNVDNLAFELSLKQRTMAELEWYKEGCEKDGGIGYYDAFKNEGIKDIRADRHRINLGMFWDDLIKLWESHELPSDFQSQNKWINAGNTYRRLFEPLDIAHYYVTAKGNAAKANKNYLTGGRPHRHEVLQKWMEEKEKTRSSRGQKSRTKPASLTEDSCFWAYVEEAMKNLENLKQNQCQSQQDQHQSLQRLVQFEEYVRTMKNALKISSDVFLEGNSFMMWSKEWEEYKRDHSL